MVKIACPSVEKHAVKMMEELHRMKRDNEQCDFIIQVGDDVYYTHKNVLSSGSDYFKAMLKHDTKESRERKVVFKDVDSECVKNCIDFIYSGEFEIPDEKIYDLLYIAIMMQLEDVKQAVSDILERSITVENYFSTRKVANMYGLDAVSTRCRVFLQENIMEISMQPEFQNIEKNDILNSVKSERSELCEEAKVTLLLRWVENNRKNVEHLDQCLEVIKFHRMSPAFVEHLLESNLIFCDDVGLYDLINGHLLKASKRLRKSKEEIDNRNLIILFDQDTDCIRSLNPITRNVEKFHDEKFQHFQCFETISLDSYIYVLCENKSVHRLDCRSKNSKWEKMKDMICDHGEFPRSVSWSGSIYVIGGSHPIATDAVETFTPSLNQWFQLQNKPTANRDASLVSLDDSIYCIGGVGRDYIEVSSFCRFTPSSSEWVDLEPMRYAVTDTGVVAVNSKIFAIGGYSGGIEFDYVSCYDVTSAHWTVLSSMISGHRILSAHHIDKWIYAVGYGNISDVIEKYDVSKDKWIMVKPKVDKCFTIYESTFIKV